MTEFLAGSTPDGARAELLVSGEVDIAVADALHDAALAALGPDLPGLVVDLSGLTFLDSTGIGALVRIRNDVIAGGRTLTLANPTARIVRILDVTGLSTVFDIDPEYVSSARTDRG
ncbi:MAG: STAS domain-containing protein [Marmoricola sp.]